MPEPGVLDALASRSGPDDPSFIVVGYGLPQVKPLSDRSRLVGTVSLINLRSQLTDGPNVEFSNNAGHWTGGTCFGDSGGPAFLGTSNVVVAVTSFGMNGNCAGAGFNAWSTSRSPSASSRSGCRRTLTPAGCGRLGGAPSTAHLPSL